MMYYKVRKNDRPTRPGYPFLYCIKLGVMYSLRLKLEFCFGYINIFVGDGHYPAFIIYHLVDCFTDLC